MTDKSQDQIEKDKEAVAKMIGAKSNMEAAIRRIAALEDGVRRLDNLVKEQSRLIAPDAKITTRCHSEFFSLAGNYCNEEKTVDAHSFKRQSAIIVAGLLD